MRVKNGVVYDTKNLWAIVSPKDIKGRQGFALCDDGRPLIFHTRKAARHECRLINLDGSPTYSYTHKYKYTVIALSFFYNLNRKRCS